MIFKVEGGFLVLAKEEIRGVKEFKVLLERDKGSEGDADGRKKLHAFKEFYYIYLTCDFKSYLVNGGYTEKEIHLKAVKGAGLPEGWKADAAIKAAMAVYTEIQEDETPTATFLIKTIQGVRMGTKVMQVAINAMEATLDLMSSPKEGETPNLSDLLLNTDNLAKQLEIINKMANAFPKTLKTLEELQDKITKEKSGKQLARGGEEIGNRADPK